jgi:hypothetical protein
LEENIEKTFDSAVSFFSGGMPRFQRMRGPCVVLLFTAVFSLNLKASYSNFSAFRDVEKEAVGKNLEILGSYASSPEYLDSDFIINFSDLLNHLIASYYALFGRAYTLDNGGIESSRLRVMKSSFRDGDIYAVDPLIEDIHNTTDGEKLFENDALRVYRLTSESMLMSNYGGISHKIDIELVDGVYEAMRRLESRAVTFEIMTLKDRNTSMSFTFHGELAGAGVKVLVNDECLYSLKAEGRFFDLTLKDVPLKAGRNDILLAFDGDISRAALTSVQFN